MKAPIVTLIIFFSLCFGLAGCSSSRSVKSELGEPSVKLYRDAHYRIEVASGEGSSLDFGPRAQNRATDSLNSALAARDIRVAGSRSEARYIVTFGTFTEEERESFVSAFPQRSVRAYSSPRGLSTPLGTVVTGHDTHVVETEMGAGAIAFKDSDRVFVVDVKEAKSGELLWRGYTRRASSRLKLERLEKEIFKIIEAIPFAEPETDESHAGRDRAPSRSGGDVI